MHNRLPKNTNKTRSKTDIDKIMTDLDFENIDSTDKLDAIATTLFCTVDNPKLSSQRATSEETVSDK